MALSACPHIPCLHGKQRIASQGQFNLLHKSASYVRLPASAQGIYPATSRPKQQYRQHAAVAASVEPAVAQDAANDTMNISKGDDVAQQSPNTRAIRVGDKPAARALINRLDTVTQTVIRAATSSEQHTYRTIATIATAQKQLNRPNSCLIYVPYSKSSTFTALVLPASDSVQQTSSSNNKLTVRADTDAKALANTLTFDLIKKGSGVLLSAGAAATAKAGAALVLVRKQLLTRGYEVGVLPRFEEGQGKEKQITILSQQVVLQELPTTEVILPRSQQVPLTKQVVLAQKLLQQQRRVQLLMPHYQLARVTDLMSDIMQPAGAEASMDEESGNHAKGPAAGKKRLLLVWPPSATEQLLESLEQLDQPTTTSAARTAVPDDSTAGTAVPAIDPESLVQLQVRVSRYTTLPVPQVATAGATLRDVRKPVVANADSSVSGLAGAIEARVTRAGAAWLWSDGSVQGNKTAWEALVAASRKMDAADGAGGLLALLDVQQSTPSSKQQQQEQEMLQQQVSQPQGKEGEAFAAPSRMRMLIVRYSDIARNLLQSPNTPIEVLVNSDLWPLLKFASIANTFLPLSATTGSGGLLLLPAVLPAPEAAAVAVDYRFQEQTVKQHLVPYAIRLQRFTGSLPQGIEVQDAQQLRVSLGTDPVKLRDAIVAKVLQQEPASVRFVGPLGRTPPLLSIAMAAVAAARVRLQQKGAAVDVGVMPYAETLVLANARADGTDSADAGKRETGAKLGKGSSKSWGKQGAVTAKSSGQASRVVYSLRLVPLPPVSAGAEDR